MDSQKVTRLIISGAVVLVLILLLSNTVFLTIQPSERGVIFRKFTSGLDKDNIFDPGFQIVAPWNTMHIYDVKERTEDETMPVLDKNGLAINV
ncbi:MAG: SPFH domain-containing protein, partial [Bacteroidota bacterium]